MQLLCYLSKLVMRNVAIKQLSHDNLRFELVYAGKIKSCKFAVHSFWGKKIHQKRFLADKLVEFERVKLKGNASRMPPTSCKQKSSVMTRGKKEDFSINKTPTDS